MRVKGADGHEYSVTGQGQGNFNTAGGIAGILSLLGFDLGSILGRGYSPSMSSDALIAALNAQKTASNTGSIEAILGVIMALMASQSGGSGRCGGSCSENMPVSRYDLSQSEKMTAIMNENALLKANIHTDEKLSDVYERLTNKINTIAEAQSKINLEQAVYNGTNNAAISCIKNQIAQLQGLTELVVPSSRVCNTNSCG